MSAMWRLIGAVVLFVGITAAGIVFVDLVLHYNDTTGWTGGASGLIGSFAAVVWIGVTDRKVKR